MSFNVAKKKKTCQAKIVYKETQTTETSRCFYSFVGLKVGIVDRALRQAQLGYCPKSDQDAIKVSYGLTFLGKRIRKSQRVVHRMDIRPAAPQKPPQVHD